MNFSKCHGMVLALCGGVLVGFPALSEEHSANILTPLNGAVVSGYVNSSSHWSPGQSAGDPSVGVVAIRPVAHEGKFIGRSPRTGAFKFFRTGDISKPLTVYFTVDGTATPGDDFVAFSNGKAFFIQSGNQPAGNFSPAWISSGTITVISAPPVIISLPPPPPVVVTVQVLDFIVIPAGRRTATLTIDPRDDRRREMPESVVISLVSDHDGLPSRATLQIIDND